MSTASTKNRCKHVSRADLIIYAQEAGRYRFCGNQGYLLQCEGAAIRVQVDSLLVSYVPLGLAEQNERESTQLCRKRKR